MENIKKNTCTAASPAEVKRALREAFKAKGIPYESVAGVIGYVRRESAGRYFRDMTRYVRAGFAERLSEAYGFSVSYLTRGMGDLYTEFGGDEGAASPRKVISDLMDDLFSPQKKALKRREASQLLGYSSPSTFLAIGKRCGYLSPATARRFTSVFGYSEEYLRFGRGSLLAYAVDVDTGTTPSPEEGRVRRLENQVIMLEQLLLSMKKTNLSRVDYSDVLPQDRNLARRVIKALSVFAGYGASPWPDEPRRIDGRDGTTLRCWEATSGATASFGRRLLPVCSQLKGLPRKGSPLMVIRFVEEYHRDVTAPTVPIESRKIIAGTAAGAYVNVFHLCGVDALVAGYDLKKFVKAVSILKADYVSLTGIREGEGPDGSPEKVLTFEVMPGFYVHLVSQQER